LRADERADEKRRRRRGPWQRPGPARCFAIAVALLALGAGLAARPAGAEPEPAPEAEVAAEVEGQVGIDEAAPLEGPALPPIEPPPGVDPSVGPELGAQDLEGAGLGKDGLEEGVELSEEPPPPGEWAPPLPDALQFDWLQVRSGEWLKGELLRLRDYRVHFDSDEFDELDLDWEKVTAFYLPRPHSFRVADRVVFGTAELRGELLRVRTPDGVLEFPRSELSAIAQGSGSELDWWSLRIGGSVNLREGNSRQTELSGNAELRRETAMTRMVSTYRGTYAKADGTQNANNHRSLTKFDYFLTRRFYWTIPFVEVYADEQQELDLRLSPGSALGYELLRTSWVELEMSLGTGYQYTRLSGKAEETRTSHDLAIVYSAELDFDLPGGTEWDNVYRLQLVATDYGKTSHHAESVLSFDVWGPLDLDVSGTWDRIQDPAKVDDDDDDPKRDDFRLLVGLSLEF
jgi:hypothetical protein